LTNRDLRSQRQLANSSHKCNFCGLNERDKCLGKEFIGSFVGPRFSRPVVQQEQRLFDLRGCHRLEVGALGEELAQQAVGVLVDPPLPGRIRRREVRRGLERGRHLLVLHEFGPVIEGQRLHLVRYGREESDDSLLNRLRRFLWYRGTEREQGFALHHGHQRTRAIPAYERVAFPVPDPPLVRHDGRAGLNGRPIGNA